MSRKPAIQSRPVALCDEDIALLTAGLSGPDRELVVTTFTVKTAFTGASLGDTVTATQILDISDSPTTLSTVWRNQSTGTDLASAPAAANLEIVGSTALTDAQLRASPVPVSGPVTDAQLRAAPVPVSGPLTDTQLRATAVPVAPNVTRGTGAVDSNTQRVTLATDGPGVTALTSIDTKTPALVNNCQPVIKGQQLVADCTIASGQSLSAGVDLGAFRLVGLSIPDTFEPATLTFQSSFDNVTWNNLFTSAGAEVSVTAGPSRRIVLAPQDFYGVRYVRVRGGTAAAPTTVAAQRVIRLIAEG